MLPRWVVNVGLLVGLYAAVMIGAALWMPHEWDWQVFKWVGSRVSPAFSPEVSIVDVSWDSSDVAKDRRRIANFLDGLVKSGQTPNAVILDVEFFPCQSRPCGAPMESARNVLVASIRTAARHFPVYATEEPSVGRDDVVSGPLDPQDPKIYSVVSGAAQTRFTSIPNAQGLFYRICYAGVPFLNESGELQGSESVWSMVVRVLMTPRIFESTPPCDSAHIPVRIGRQTTLASEAVYQFSDARTFSHYSQFDDKMFVIVGTIEDDRAPFTDRSGPELLGWALSNALDQGSLLGKTAYYDVQPQNAMLLLLVPAFSALAVLAYVALFSLFKGARLRALRPLAPWLSSALAAVVGLAIFAAFEAWLFVSHHIQPQVSLISLGIVLAAGLGGFRGRQILFDEANAVDAAPTESYDYDVFISYAHEEAAWVLDNVVAPFRQATLADGRRLSIFLDTSSIRSGTAWQTTLSLAIDASRFIIPVYSDAYFKAPYCRFEIMRAHRKWVLAGDESRCVLPIMRGHPAIPPAVNDIQAVSIDDYPDVVRQLVAEIVTRLSPVTQHVTAQPKVVAP